MNNIKILKSNIDVSRFLKQLQDHPEDWGSQKNLDDSKQLDPTKYTVTVDVLQLVMGGITYEGEYVGNTEICIPTPAYNKHSKILSTLKKQFGNIYRCGFLALPVGEIVGSHIDEGTYYRTKDRYHLSIQGTYKYTVGEESIIVKPGTLFWFNNDLNHSAENVGDDVRITFVFDSDMSYKKK